MINYAQSLPYSIHKKWSGKRGKCSSLNLLGKIEITQKINSKNTNQTDTEKKV